MKKIFLDFGFRYGEGFEKINDYLQMDDAWEMIVYEPNTEIAVEEAIEKLNAPCKVEYRKQAVWVYDGTIEFLVEDKRERYKGHQIPETEEGLFEGEASHISILSSRNSNMCTKKVDVPCVDIKTILEEHRGKEIYIKADIEGAEFEIVKRIISENLCSDIKLMWIEWHPDDLGPDYESLRVELIDTLRKNGVRNELWN